MNLKKSKIDLVKENDLDTFSTLKLLTMEEIATLKLTLG